MQREDECWSIQGAGVLPPPTQRQSDNCFEALLSVNSPSNHGGCPTDKPSRTQHIHTGQLPNSSDDMRQV